MVCRGRVAAPTLVALTLSLVVHGLAPLPLAAGGAAGPQVFKAEQLTPQQFEALPDSAVIESKGQRLTKGQIRARDAQRQAEAMAKIQAAARQAQAQFEARRAQFLQQQQAQLAADNARAMAEFARLRQASATPQARQLEAIQQEAAQLHSRSKTASPAERAQIEQRAGELLKQLQQVPR